MPDNLNDAGIGKEKDETARTEEDAVPVREHGGRAEAAGGGRDRGRKTKMSGKKPGGLEEKAAKADEYFDNLLRLKAEFDNYRKRVSREREEYTAYAIEEIVADFLGVVDNLERALHASGNSGDSDSLHRGVEITLKDSLKMLERWGVEEVPALGLEFDPEKHEAMERVESEDNDGKVVEVLRKGYSFKDRLIRPALVKVGRRAQ